MSAAIVNSPAAPALAHRSGLFVLALWGRHFRVVLQEDIEQPALYQGSILLPAAWRDRPATTGLYRAAACHAAAHLIHGGQVFERGELRPRQQVLIGILEDARVEALTLTQFPGLRRQWLAFHPVPALDNQSFDARLRRLTRALLSGVVEDEDAWLRKAVAEFHGQSRRWMDPGLSRELGLRLAHDLGQMRIAMDEGQPFQSASYRDDNAHLWAEMRTHTADDKRELEAKQHSQDGARWREAANGQVLALAEHQGSDGIQGSWYLYDEPEHAQVEYLRQASDQQNRVLRYPEWDYRTHILRRDWCVVHTRRPMAADPDRAVALVYEYRAVLARMRRLALTLHLERLQRVRRQREGDELDLEALLQAHIELRSGFEPDPRMYFRTRPMHDRGLASLVLLDLSESCNDPVPEAGHSLLELTRTATLLLGHTLQVLGEPFALLGFNSNGRHAVDCLHIKDFGEVFDMTSEARIAGLQARHSTRLGAALRHGLWQLAQRGEHSRLLLVVTDGVPADIDVYDDEYLAQDVRHAVQEARREGMVVYCLSLDAAAQRRMTQMFGSGHFRLLDHPGRLPELLPQLLLSLTRRY